MEEKRVWGIHTMDDYLFLNANVIAIGWKDMGDLSKIGPDKEALKEKYKEVYPDSKPGAIPTSVGMLYRFAYEMQIGDYVVFPSKVDKMINIGVIEGDYTYVEADNEYVQRRKVKWLKHLPKNIFSQGALYEVGAFLSVFLIKNYADEFLSALEETAGKSTTDPDDIEAFSKIASDIADSTQKYILKILSKNLKGYDLEDFVAQLLEAMGYRTKVSQQGGDSGIDIIAYKDELPPRILVQVKSGDSDVGEATIQSLKGAMSEGDYGLFVTLANYTKNAQKYLDNKPIIRGINGTELVELILKYYDALSDKYKQMIPLKKVYVPDFENK